MLWLVEHSIWFEGYILVKVKLRAVDIIENTKCHVISNISGTLLGLMT